MGISAIVGDWGLIGAQIMYMHVGLVAVVLMILRWSIPESPLWLAAKDELRRGIATVRAQKTGWRDLLEGKYLWPFISLCIFYTFTNLAANTGGQFGAYVAVNVVGISVSTHSLWGLLILPVSVASGLMFMRVVDTSKRVPFFIFGAVMMSGDYFVPVLFNFSPLSTVLLPAVYQYRHRICLRRHHESVGARVIPHHATRHRAGDCRCRPSDLRLVGVRHSCAVERGAGGSLLPADGDCGDRHGYRLAVLPRQAT